ncbi:exodeoxyribonuclease V subunit beta [Candidatus Pantoea carbekii]
MMQSSEFFFNPLRLKLYGECLIESSAGTGKTFTISILYLRLLLGLGGKYAYMRPLSVEEILVVTFTEAATAEIRDRIHQNIHELRLACIRKYSYNSMLMELLNDILDPADAALLLLAAERQMDQAAIFTIHGFCQRMLTINAFESGIFFNQKLIEDEKNLFQEATTDFWRSHFYPLPFDIAKIIFEKWSGPEKLLETLYPFLQSQGPTLNFQFNENETLISLHEKNLLLIDTMKTKWLKKVPTIFTLLSEADVDKRIYNNKYLPLWIEKISLWADSKTCDYKIPSELIRFGQKKLRQKKNKDNVPYDSLFLEIDEFLEKDISLHNLIISKALQEIHSTVKKQKHLKAILSFNDLLSLLDDALKKTSGNELAQSIRQRFPVALIDEFQDTDPLQYRIFRALYSNQPSHALLLIGDPKQAIYGFRGADIFTYIQARNEIKSHYTLDINWRSSSAMIDSVNQIFSRINNPFIFNDISFLPVKCAFENQKLTFLLDNQPQPAFRFWLQPGNSCSINNYQKYMAQQCAASISVWLEAGQQQRAQLGKEKMLRPIQASDITVLVRNHYEAHLICNALNQFNICSVYLSNRNSVYSTLEARELIWLLKAVLEPECESTVRTALATSLFSFSALQLENLYQDIRYWDKLVNVFSEWQLTWQQYGLLPMLRQIMNKYHLPENLLASKNGERRLTDLMHLGELLQEVSFKLDTQHALVRYLERKVASPNTPSIKEQQRLEHDRCLVHIVTIHKSKGLQYPIVCLPFAVAFRELNTILTLMKSTDESFALAKQKRLAEDLRLLYVALTRSIYHCSVGIAPIVRNLRECKINKANVTTDLHLSALGYLLQQGKEATANQLKVILDKISSNNPIFEVISSNIVGVEQNKQQKVKDNILLSARKITRQLCDPWCVTSYTKLVHHHADILHQIIPNLDIDVTTEKNNFKKDNITSLTPHEFPRGTIAGTFLHELFKLLDFSQLPTEQKLTQYLEKNGHSAYWQPMLRKWITDVVNVPLNMKGMTLSQISQHNRLTEMSFYLPINNLLKANDFNNILRKNDILSSLAPPLDFIQIQGMLRGFIDLVFRFEGKYYLLDYKSNWLGTNSKAYNSKTIIETMINHRYDLQYQLYTLALHRYLQHHLVNYQYEENFGGVFYLFLRGIESNNFSNSSIFYTRPKYECIFQLDTLFRTKAMIQ